MNIIKKNLVAMFLFISVSLSSRNNILTDIRVEKNWRDDFNMHNLYLSVRNYCATLGIYLISDALKFKLSDQAALSLFLSIRGWNKFVNSLDQRVDKEIKLSYLLWAAKDGIVAAWAPHIALKLASLISKDYYGTKNSNDDFVVGVIINILGGVAVEAGINSVIRILLENADTKSAKLAEYITSGSIFKGADGKIYIKSEDNEIYQGVPS